MLTIPLFAAVVVAFVGVLILWSNPERPVNRAVCLNSFFIALWLACTHVATTRVGALDWLRWTCVAGALIPLGFWTVKESIEGGGGFDDTRTILKKWGWIVAGTLVLVILPWTDFFIPTHSTDEERIRGWGYYAYMWLLLGVYCFMFYSGFRRSVRVSGARRLELQIWLGGGCSMFIAAWALSWLSTATQDPVFRRLVPITVLGFYAATGILITVHRIFDARQIVLVTLEKALLVMVVASVAYFAQFGLGQLLSPTPAFVGTVMLSLWLAITLNGWLNRVFQFYPQATAARQATFAVARNESRVEKLEQAFCSILKGWGQTEHAIILSGAKGPLTGCGLEIAEDHPAVRALRQLRWATPERLARERSTPERLALRTYLAEQALGALVIVEGATLTAIVGVGVAASRRPITYPQVSQLMELVSIIENALERAHFSVKAQHAEQLATVGLLGASLAHEIRNPLVTIKTFVHLLPNHHQEQTFRDKFFTLIGDEVTRIDRLTEQLLDLASPRAYQPTAIQLHPVLRSSLELVSAKATDKRIEFLTDFQADPDGVFTDPSAAKQVLLNLCFNAIQAVETQPDNRWIKVSTRRLKSAIEVVVEDSGPGIAPGIRPRLFQPFQSTKSSGFGLGLAICSDILTGLDASISVDPSTPGRGAVFRIVFPCQAS